MLGVGFLFAFAVLSAICSGYTSAYGSAASSSHSPQDVAGRFVPGNDIRQEIGQQETNVKSGGLGEPHMNSKERVVERSRKRYRRGLSNSRSLDSLSNSERRGNNRHSYMSGVGKDYIIALELMSRLSNTSWNKKLSAFVKQLVQALSKLNGKNRLSLVTFNSTSEIWLDRGFINNETVRSVGKRIDKMFESMTLVEEAKPGEALEFLRQSVYNNGDKYLLNDKTTNLDLNSAAGKDTVVFIITSGAAGDKELAMQEAFDARRNGVTLLVIEIGIRSEKFWASIVGCRQHFGCPQYITTHRKDLMSKVEQVMKQVRSHRRKDAICHEEWSEYSACSEPCGTGIKTSTLISFKTLLSPSNGKGEIIGRTCEKQLQNVKVRQMLCNMQPCRGSRSVGLNHGIGGFIQTTSGNMGNGNTSPLVNKYPSLIDMDAETMDEEDDDDLDDLEEDEEDDDHDQQGLNDDDDEQLLHDYLTNGTYDDDLYGDKTGDYFDDLLTEDTHDKMPKELPANAHKEMHTQEFELERDDEMEEQAADKSIPVENFKVKSEWYEPGVRGVPIKPLETKKEVDLKKMRIANIRKNTLPPSHIPRLYDDDKGIDDMLRYAPDVNRRIGNCKWLGKDYVVALDDSAKLKDVGDYEKVRSFVKMLAYSLSATVGTNTLSLVSYDKTAREVLGRTIIDKDNIRSVAVKIDEMFDTKNSAEEANPGAALKFLREKVYEDREKYLVDDKTSEMRLVDAPGVNTVVFLITTGKVADEVLASNEAFNARRNGVTLFVVEIGKESEKFWPAAMGCRYYYVCPKYITTSASNIMGRIEYVIKSVCSRDGRDAVCLEAWSDYTPCSVPCGSGVQTANLLGFTQLLGPSNGEGEGKGRSCKDLLKNVKVKQVLCNTQRCGTDGSPIAAVGGVDSVGHASTELPKDGVSGVRTDEAENVMPGTRNNEVAVADAGNSANVESQNSDSLASHGSSATEPREVAITESDLPKEGDDLTVHRETEGSVSTRSEADLSEQKGERTPHSESTVVGVHEHNVREGLGGQGDEESTPGSLDVGVTQAGGDSEREVSSGTTHEHQQMENQALVPDTITSVLPTTESESARNPEEEPASQETELTEQLQSEQLENGTTGDESITTELHTTGSSTNTIEGGLTSGQGSEDSGSHANVGDHTQIDENKGLSDAHHLGTDNTRPSGSVPTYEIESGTSTAHHERISEHQEAEREPASVHVKAPGHTSTGENQPENQSREHTTGGRRGEDRDSNGTGSVIMVSAAASGILVLVAAAVFRRYASDMNDDVVDEDNEFLSGESGGKTEEAETYRLADASDNVWM
ncbi:hypothetical protein BBBOND_0202760 [Babesia bigemina]|uniref:VWFA domain-containing protein n=1 Tax=Babesia bigemina TaxID=5866 RepID=A0A061D872_BABBI|nr:hypothetical protein BBBOND_0202760 [Babesia bigemina]CDR95119.1 hypothetical protein BBBOND_0202760 [Babesia bigemina]|eukprot:XP_012767305.1 hypothetical protein BBBOND_0202760 [Babesia bigemina]